MEQGGLGSLLQIKKSSN